jgi:hypothetical protein
LLRHAVIIAVPRPRGSFFFFDFGVRDP